MTLIKMFLSNCELIFSVLFMLQITESLCNRSCDVCKFPQRVSADLMRLTEAEQLNRQSKSASFIIARSANPTII
jgi:hypothetical protein